MKDSSDPWSHMVNDEARRVSSEGKHDFFWIVVDHHSPGLMLKLPSLPGSFPKLPKLKNLNLTFRRTGGAFAFVIALNDPNQREVFESLCRDVVAAGESAEQVDDALVRAVKRTQRWHYLLRGGKNKGLSVEEQRGLVGELAFLRELVAGVGADAAIDAWKGPTGSAKDFEFIGCCVEVKARRAAAKPYVLISSENQLADVEGSKLFLKVWNISSAVAPEGQSLHDHVRMTSQLFEKSITAYDQWEESIDATGYDVTHDYEGLCWHIVGSKTFEVVDGFPRIVGPLPIGVEALKYSLSLDACTKFETYVDPIQVIKEAQTHD